MRLVLLALVGGILSSCVTASTFEDSIRRETVRLEQEDGAFVLKAGTYADQSGFVFNIRYRNTTSELGSPTGVTWTVDFSGYCRDRSSWVESVLIAPTGEKWRGYRVAVPAGPVRRQDWSSGGDGADRYGGPSTPGLLNAIERGGQFVLALEDDTGVRHNTVVINTLTPQEREALFQAAPRDQPRPSKPLMVVTAEAPEPSRAADRCPDV